MSPSGETHIAPVPAGGRTPSSTDVTALHVPSPATKGESSGTHLGEVWSGVRLERLLGRGGMGAVYLGTQLDLNRPVAVKVLPSHLSDNPQFRERFELEAKAVARISSPHVVQVYFTGVHQGHHFFVMEFVDGEDLARRLKSGLKPSYRQALDLVIQAAKGLAAAGEQGVIHRDIKPGNMMVDRKGLLKLMDFGLARLASAAHGLTMTGTVMGTVSYFSPEQGRGEPCDQRTDIYALGVVFYELLTGRLPFTGENATSIIYQHIHVPPRAPRELDPQIPEDYQAVVLKCMQKRADDRYVDAHELLSDLERLAAGQPPAIALARRDLLATGATIVAGGSLTPAPVSDRAPSGSRRWLLVATGALACVGAGWWLWSRAAAPATPTGGSPTTELPAVSTAAAEPSVAGADSTPRTEPPAAAGMSAPPDRAVPIAASESQQLPGTAVPPPPPPATSSATANSEPTAPSPTAAAPSAVTEMGSAAQPLSADREDVERREALAAAEALLTAGRLEEADAALSALAKRFPGDRETAALLVRLEAAKVQALRAATAAAERSEDPNLALARAAAQRGDVALARRLLQGGLAARPDDPHWLAFAETLAVVEGHQALEEATQALKRGQFEAAAAALQRAERLLPADPEVAALRTKLDEEREHRQRRERAIAEAERLLADGQPQQAEERLAELAAAAPDDALLAGLLRRAAAARERQEAQRRALAEQLALGEAALARNELDVAHLAFTAALQLDPSHAGAARGLEAVRQRHEQIDAARQRLEAALRANDVPAAERELAELERVAAGHPVLALAGARVEAARVAEAEARARAEASEQERQQRASVLLARLDDRSIPLPTLESELAAFVAEAGETRPELPELRRRLADRQAEAALAAQLTALDDAVARRDASAIAALFLAAGDAEPFVAFAAMPGASLRSRLLQCLRSGDEAVVTIELRHAMEHAPEERLPVRWVWRRQDGGWRVAAASLAPVTETP